MDDKNKELSELLGIEPRYIGYTDYQHGCPCGTRYVRKNYNELEDLLKDGTLKCINSNPIYPDFEKPENFVKLLKLVLKAEGWCSDAVIFWEDNSVDVADVFLDSKDKSIEENFIEAILLSVKEHINNCDEWEEVKQAEILLKSLKQQAKQTDWGVLNER